LPEFLLHPLATDDLDSITYYTAITWGEDQARLYGQQLMQAVSNFLEGRKIGKSFSPNMPQLKLLHSGHHYICVAEQTEETLLVLAIFHERMNLAPRIRQRLKAMELAQ
jgi:toxin ParE1/3/4